MNFFVSFSTALNNLYNTEHQRVKEAFVSFLVFFSKKIYKE